MPVTALPTPPSRADPTNFAARADAFLAALPTFVTEINAAIAAGIDGAVDATTGSFSGAVRIEPDGGVGAVWYLFDNGICEYGRNAAAAASAVHFRMMRNTDGGIVSNGDEIFLFAAEPHVGGAAGYRHTAGIRFQVDGAVSVGDVPTKIVFETTDAGVYQDAWEITPTGLFKAIRSSVGIKYPLTRSPSTDVSVLDYYVESTFTPTVTLGGANVGMTLGTAQGSYTYIGNRMHFDLSIVATAKGSSTGTLAIAGLPEFSVTRTGYFSALRVRADGLTGITGSLQGTIPSNSKTISLTFLGTGTETGLTDAHLTNTFTFWISGTYETPT